MINNPSGLSRLRPDNLRDSDYFKQIETFLRQVYNNQSIAVSLPRYTVAELLADKPDPAKYPNSWVYCTDETGGAVPVFSDGTDWRRSTDRTIVS